MNIHNGEKYTITADGVMAQKSDGNTVRCMKYYPERDISALAGEIDELTAWQIFYDVARQIPNSQSMVCPENILIDGDHFVLSDWSAGADYKYAAPEGYSPIWALAATVFYVFLGCNVFQGLGGRGQSSTAPIPTLRRDLPVLSQLIVQCLDFDPNRRPTLSQVADIANQNILRCQAALQPYPPQKKVAAAAITADEIDAFWPEEMV